jgi:diketogulonate reductase-like aldo/keto reductase
VFKLANGVEVPLVGFGTAGLGGLGEEVVREALQAGFLHIDTAQASEWYDEEAVGRAVASVAGTIPRKDVFLTTKVHPRYFGYEQTLESFKRSLEKLQTDVRQSCRHPCR